MAFDHSQGFCLTDRRVLEMQFWPKIVPGSRTSQITIPFKIFDNNITRRIDNHKYVNLEQAAESNLHPPAATGASCRHDVFITTFAHNKPVDVPNGRPWDGVIVPILDGGLGFSV